MLHLRCRVLEKLKVLRQKYQNALERKPQGKSGKGCTSLISEKGKNDSSCLLSAHHTQSPSYMSSHSS